MVSGFVQVFLTSGGILFTIVYTFLAQCVL